MCLNPVFIPQQWLYVDCGKCIECKIKRAKQWAYRVSLEAAQYKDNCLLTLTYNDANLPDRASLSRRDLQLFMKRLRKAISPLKVRFFACGEYGSEKNTARPHYHIILFGWKPSDLYYFFTDKKGYKMYRSPLVEKIWLKGFSTVGAVEFDTAKYVAIYLMKPPKDGRQKPFVVMSRRPGIAHDCFKPEWLFSDKIYVQGKYISIPKYYLDILERDYGYDLSEFRERRKDKARSKSLVYMDVYSDEWQQAQDELKIRRDKFERIFKKSLDKYFNV